MTDSYGVGSQAGWEQARSRLDGWVRQARETAATNQELARRVEEIRETQTSRDRAVRVTVDAGGRLVDLELRSEAASLYPSDLARMILDCVDQARSRAAQRTSQMAAEAWGEDSSLTEQVRQAYRPRTGADASARTPGASGPGAPGAGGQPATGAPDAVRSPGGGTQERPQPSPDWEVPTFGAGGFHYPDYGRRNRS